MNAGLGHLPKDRKRVRRFVAGRLAALLMLCSASLADAAVEQPVGSQSTPPRLGLIEGEVLFWRPGDGDWETAQLNTPLAAGDALATRDGQLELQVGGSSFVRAGSGTQLRLESNEPEFLHIALSAGHLAVDLRDLRRGAVQIDTPNASVSIARDGYYRVDVDEQSTRVVVRRGGHATATQSGGTALAVGTGEAVEINGSDIVQVSELAAPPFDDWDRWNYDRADRYLAAPRSSAVAEEVYGVEELDRHGNWRYVNTYGRVWVPDVPVGWAPYSDGRWRWDPLYGYSWVDYAPWGWAPFHYGRWVYAGYWAWAPGPIIATPVYSPALVAFFGGPGISVGIGVPFVSWVALGWGEPLYPWWGGVGFIGSPCWWGWGGPRVVNNIVINNGDVINGDVNIYRNQNVPGALVGVPKDQFDTSSVQRARLNGLDGAKVDPVRGALPVSARGGGIDGGRKSVPNLTGARSQDAQASATGSNNFSRGNGQADGAGNFNRQRDSQAALKAGSGVSSNGRPDNSTFDALRQRGNGAGTGNAVSKGGSNLARSSGDGAATGNVRRGGAAPSLSGEAKGGSTFDALRGRNSAGAALQGSNSLRRGQSPPPLGGSGKAGASAFDSIRRGGGASPSARGATRNPSVPSRGSSNLTRQSAPPLANSGSKAGSATAPLQRFGGSAARQPSARSSGSANLQRGQSAPPPRGGSKMGSATAPLQRSGGSVSRRPSLPSSGSANVRRGQSASSAGSANLRRSQSPPAIQRGGKGGSASAPLQRYSGSSTHQLGRSQSRAQVANIPRTQSGGTSRSAGVRVPQSSGSKAAAPSARSYSAPSYSRSTSPQSAPSAGVRSLSRSGGGSYGGSVGGGANYSRSMGGGMRSGGGMSSGGRSVGMGGGSRGGAMSSGKMGR
jgi:hypothetical protein